MKNMSNKVPVVFIADNNFFVPTVVAISSLIENMREGTFYDISVICIEIGKEDLETLKKLSAKRASVTVFDLSNKYESIGVEHPHVSKAALFKFDIPNIFPDLEKILYLDGDILIKSDLSALFNTPLDDFYVAAARDMVGERVGLSEIVGVEKYFNSGVMLMNLKLMRENNITSKLLDVRKERNEFKTMDQDVLNYVLKEKVFWLEPKYNAMVFNLIHSNCSIDEINHVFRVNYRDFNELIEDASIIHLTNYKKPWLHKFTFMNGEWFKYFNKIPYLDRGDIAENKSKSYEIEMRSLQLEIRLRDIETSLEGAIAELKSANKNLELLEANLKSSETKLNASAEKLDLREAELNSANTEMDSINTKFNLVNAELSGIYASREWKTALMLRKLVGMLIPKESLRRKLIVIFWRAIKLPAMLLLSAILLIRKAVCRLKPKKHRKINLKSKKIVYVGHSYHDKTKSTVFLIDYLKEFYNVEVVLDESWMGKPYPDLSFVDESYLGVIFFQNLPEKGIMENIKNDNLIFFPMYDGVRHDFEFWNENRGLKVVNFSTTLHDLLKQWGLDSLGVQFFPQPQEFIPGKKDGVFFWQRLTRINIEVVVKLFVNENLKIHIHKAIDPNQEFIKPSEEDEKKFQITYSDWFETREEMWDSIKEKGIYIAPREFEGIGMSFLEAMAMGKAVVAVNNPTMNEYIKNGETGYLFDLNDPKKIDLSNIEKVQKNTHKFMRQGYAKWQQDKNNIIDFIKKP